MNRNKIILLVLLVFYFVVGILSCAKKQNPDTSFGWVLGKWKLAQTSTDGALAFYEPVSKAQNWVWNFTNEGTATEINNYNGSPNIAINYTWKIIGTDSLWMGTSGAGHDTTTYYISIINSKEMILTYMDTTITGNKSATGYYFTKD